MELRDGGFTALVQVAGIPPAEKRRVVERLPSEAPVNRLIEKNITRVPFSGCWLWTKSVVRGYGRASRGVKFAYAHRVAYEDYVGPIPKGLWVLHRCDVPSCCNPAHLFLGTPKDNTADSMAKGRHKAPPRRSYWKLTDQQRSEIVVKFNAGVPAVDLAAEYGVHKSRVHQLNRAAKAENK